MTDLEAAKLHLRVDNDDEDDAIQDMLDAATAAVMDYLNVEPDSDYDMPAPVWAAILLQVGDLYANRERQGEQQLFVSSTYERLLAPYRVMAV